MVVVSHCPCNFRSSQRVVHEVCLTTADRSLYVIFVCGGVLSKSLLTIVNDWDGYKQAESNSEIREQDQRKSGSPCGPGAGIRMKRLH